MHVLVVGELSLQDEHAGTAHAAELGVGGQILVDV